MYRFIIVLFCFTLFCSCKSNKDNSSEDKENLEAKKMLQGVWVDDATDSPILKIKGDSIYYADPSNSTVKFKVIEDSLFTYGSVVNGYKIEKINQYNLWFTSATGDVLKLTKSEDQEDVSFFITDKPIQHISEVIKKDSVIEFNNVRYRGYVYINPSKMKVTQSRVSDDGINVDNVYYDNIIHICVYEGRNRLCSKDINKNMLREIIPEDFLKSAILSDMDFVGANSKGFHYQGTVCIPDDASCYLVNFTINKDNKVKMSLAK